MGNLVKWVKDQSPIGDMDKWVNEHTVMGDMNTWLDDQGMEWLWYAVPAVAAEIIAPSSVSGLISSAGGAVSKIPVIGSTLAAPINVAAKGYGLVESGLQMALSPIGLGAEEAAAAGTVGVGPGAVEGGAFAAELEAAGVAANLTPGMAAGTELAAGATVQAMLDTIMASSTIAPTELGFWGTVAKGASTALGAGLGSVIPNLIQYAGQSAISDAFRPDPITSQTTTTRTTFPEGELPTLTMPTYTAPRAETRTLEAPIETAPEAVTQREAAPLVASREQPRGMEQPPGAIARAAGLGDERDNPTRIATQTMNNALNTATRPYVEALQKANTPKEEDDLVTAIAQIYLNYDKQKKQWGIA